jgi:F-type H+-transporting ATPase subunit delta
MKQVPLSVARRYARALLEVALDKKVAPAMAERLAEAKALLHGNAELRNILLNPAVSADKKKKIAHAIWGKSDALFALLMGLLAGRGRIALLPSIAAAYADLWNAHRGVVAAEAISATPLAAAQQTALAASARTLSGREVELSTALDPNLLGGVVLKMDGRTYDGSVRTQLQRLRARLTSGELSSSSTTSPRS